MDFAPGTYLKNPGSVFVEVSEAPQAYARGHKLEKSKERICENTLEHKLKTKNNTSKSHMKVSETHMSVSKTHKT